MPAGKHSSFNSRQGRISFKKKIPKFLEEMQHNLRMEQKSREDHEAKLRAEQEEFVKDDEGRLAVSMGVERKHDDLPQVVVMDKSNDISIDDAKRIISQKHSNLLESGDQIVPPSSSKSEKSTHEKFRQPAPKTVDDQVLSEQSKSTSTTHSPEGKILFQTKPSKVKKSTKRNTGSSSLRKNPKLLSFNEEE